MNPKITDWKGKRVWLVGASSGIGAALAHQLAGRGARLALSARNADKLQALNVTDALILPCDATASDSLAAARDRMLACYAPGSGGDAREMASPLQAALAELAGRAQEGIDTTGRLLSVLRSKGAKDAKDLVARLMRLDEDTRILGELHEVCKPIVLTARFERDNLEGADPKLLAETTLRIYRDMLAQTRLLQKKLEAIVREWTHPGV